MKIRIWIVLFFFSSVVFAATPVATAVCKHWKRVCVKKTHCKKEVELRQGCYRCVRPPRHGFHLFPRVIDHNTCNVRTAEQFRAQGYRCTHPHAIEPCSRTAVGEYCDWQCIT